MNVLTLLTSYKGRMARTPYWLAKIGNLISYFVLQSVLQSALGAPGADNVRAGQTLTEFMAESEHRGELWSQSHPLIGILGLCLIGIFIYINYALDTKRAHDRGKSGWFALIGWIPVLGWAWVWIELGFLPGAKGTNRFGSSPSTRPRQRPLRTDPSLAIRWQFERPYERP